MLVIGDCGLMQPKHSKTLSQRYHGDDGAELLLTCAEGSCLAEVTLPDGPIIAQIEVVLQPRDARGLPCGPPIAAHHERLHLFPLPGGRRLGRFWMPAGISPETARQCHFRVVRDSMQGSTS